MKEDPEKDTVARVLGMVLRVARTHNDHSELDHQETVRFYGYTRETAAKFWDLALKAYLGTADEAVCRAVEEKAMVIGYTRMLRRAIRRPHEAQSPAKIARCKEMLAILLEKTDSICF